jgi:hypothetical protein
MKNLPEKIWLCLGFDASADDDFKECDEVIWNKDDTTGNGIEYIRSDIAEQMAKDFKCFKEEFMKYSVEDEFTEFLTSRRAQK